MPAEPLAVLLRVAVELTARSSATKNYLDKIGPGETGEHRPLVRTIRTALDGIEQLLPETLDSVIRFIGKGEPGLDLGLEVLASYLARFSHWFKTIHELLVYLPRQPVTPEAVSALASSFGDIYKAHQPSIILGSLFNALEFDFFQVVRDRLPDIDEIVIEEDTRNIVLQLAICDRDAPHAWAILAHELGHAVDLHEGISRAIADQFVTDPGSQAYQVVRSWCQELCADLLAAKALGPAPILALLSLEYCIFPLASIFSPSKTHPSTRWRLAVVSEYLEKRYGGMDLLKEEASFYESAAEYSLVRSRRDPKERAAVKEADERQFEFIIQPISEELYKRVDAVPMPKHLMDLSSLERCTLRLRQNLPISAQGLPRETLRREIATYRQLHLESGKQRAQMFQSLVEKFKEEPLDMPSIFLSGFRRRLEIIHEVSGHVGQLRDSTRLSQLCVDLARLDQLIASSINTSSVHENLRVRSSRFSRVAAGGDYE